MTLCITKKVESCKTKTSVNYIYVFCFPEEIFSYEDIVKITTELGFNFCEIGKRDYNIDKSSYMKIFEFIRPQNFCFDIITETLDKNFVNLFNKEQIQYLINNWDYNTTKGYENLIVSLESYFAETF